MQSEFGVGMKNAEELRLNRGGWQVCQSCERICFEYYMMIKNLTGNRLLIDICVSLAC